jgi:hypothetical protein
MVLRLVHKAHALYEERLLQKDTLSNRQHAFPWVEEHSDDELFLL